uniref:Centrosomal protein CEP104 N-terminal domain-containing protein n=1 Tax=Guillardia theta TaxID=55529 RepID=A0A7S4PDC0_GUITH|mmetsp:Transcript_48423/g.151859  ORF Transcript_48423/g.151859 Transcript_48423/m.151859 type:complete len:334 (+) Transcript_48423:203-1204(+)
MRLPFTVVHCDSFSTGSPPSNLHDATPHSTGWVSAPFPSFPQEIVLAFNGVVAVNRISILSHEHFIPSKIELMAGNVSYREAPSHTKAKYARVGYLKFSKVGPGVQGGQVQRLEVEARCCFLKLCMSAPLGHPKNLCNQIGIADIAVEGDIHVGDSSKLLQAGQQGLGFQMLLHGIDLHEDFLSAEAKSAGVNTMAGKFLRDIQRLKNDSKDREDFEEAMRLSELEKKVRVAGEQILKLEADKRSAVEREDYQIAKTVKSEIDQLNVMMEACMKDALRRPSKASNGEERQKLQDRLSTLEIEKQNAVEREDYTAAKAIKGEIEKLKARLMMVR